jgi:hypothetical protein
VGGAGWASARRLAVPTRSRTLPQQPIRLHDCDHRKSNEQRNGRDVDPGEPDRQANEHASQEKAKHCTNFASQTFFWRFHQRYHLDVSAAAIRTRSASSSSGIPSGI